MNKKIIFALLGILFVCGLGYYFVQNNLINKKISDLIQNELPENIELKYDKLHTNLISGNLSLKNVDLLIKNQGTRVLMKDFEIKDLNYFKVLNSDTIEISKINFDDMRVFIDLSKKEKINKSQKKRKNIILKLKQIDLDLKLLEFKNEKGILNARMDATHFSLKDLLIQSLPKETQNHLQYKIKKITADSLHLPLNKFQTINIGHLLIDSTSFNLKDTRLVLKDKGIDVDFDNLLLKGNALQNAFNKDSLIFDECLLTNGNVKINNSKKQTKSTKDSINKADKYIEIKNFKIKDTNFAFIDKKGKLQLKFSDTNALFSDLQILTNPESTENALTYNFINLSAKNIQHPMDMHTLTAKSMSVDPEKVSISDLEFKPDFTREVFQTKLKEEKDMINLKIPNFTMSNYDYSFDYERPYLFAKQIFIDKLNLEVYRNKYPENQKGRKPLYSEMLRKLNFEIGIEKIKLSDADISYIEQQSFKTVPGKIFFKNLNGNIYQIYNKNPQKDKVQITANTLFMGHAPTQVQWNFNIINPADYFKFNGTIKNLDGNSLDNFLTANMNAKINGTVKTTTFKMTGADWGAQGQMNMDYENIEVEVLNKKNEKKNFWSAIANFFVKNEDDKKSKINNHVKVERDQEKSFFNLLWTFLKQGLKQNMLKFQKNDKPKKD